MEFDFVRKLAKGLPKELTGTVVDILLDSGIEVYAAEQSGACDVHDESRSLSKDQSRTRYVSADAYSNFPNGDIFVPAADRELAMELIEKTEAAAYVCTDPVESLEMTDAERLQAKLLRRHRRNMAICLVVIVLAVIYRAFF